MDRTSLAKNWWVLALRGVSAIVFGILALVWPGITLTALILLFGGYSVVEGVLNVIGAARVRDGDRPWWALLLEGLVSIGAGVVAFVLPGLTALVLLYVIATWAVLTGIFEIGAAIRLRKEITGEWRLALMGVLSIGFGVLTMLVPVAGALAIVFWLGVYSIVFGVLMVALGIRLRRARTEEMPSVARAA